MLIGVPGGGQRSQGKSTQIDVVAVGEAAVVEPAATGGRGEHHRALVVGQLHRPGEEVGVQMGVGDEPDPQPGPLRGCPHRAQVPRGIDDQRAAVAQVDEIAAVTQALVRQRRHRIGQVGQPVQHLTRVGGKLVGGAACTHQRSSLGARSADRARNE